MWEWRSGDKCKPSEMAGEGSGEGKDINPQPLNIKEEQGVRERRSLRQFLSQVWWESTGKLLVWGERRETVNATLGWLSVIAFEPSRWRTPDQDL